MDNKPKDGKSMVDLALEGKYYITQKDFHEHVGDYIRQHNAENMTTKIQDISLDKHNLDFDLGGNPCPVVGFEEKKFIEDKISISNNSKKNDLYYFICIADTKKYDLDIFPQEGKIKKGQKVTINITLRVFCTTKTYPILKIVFSTKRPKDKKESKKDTARPRGTLRGPSLVNPIKKEDEIGSIFICWKIESDLSSVLDYDEIQLGDKIGEGGYGVVYKATWRGNECAVKVLESEEMVKEERDLVTRELDLLKKLASPYIVTYMGSTLIPGQKLALVMEYIKDGPLTSLLEKEPKMENKFRIKLALDIAKGMVFLHSSGVYHRDIKPDNMLVVSSHRDTNINLKITDFGTSRASSKKSIQSSDYLSFTTANDKDKNKKSKKDLSKTDEVPVTQKENKAAFQLTKGVGTLIFQAPELLNGKDDYSLDKTDVFSFGVLLWQLFTNKVPYSEAPFKDMTNFELIKTICEGKRLQIPSTIIKEIRDMISDCWNHDPKARPTFLEISQKLESLMKTIPSSTEDNDVPIPVLPEGIELTEIGWQGAADRTSVENQIGEVKENGIFVIRWSKSTNSYVLSYSSFENKKIKYNHIAYIRPQKDGSIVVDKQDGRKSTYKHIYEYVQAMKTNGIITRPLEGHYRKDEI